jgi:hypothetical protein
MYYRLFEAPLAPEGRYREVGSLQDIVVRCDGEARLSFINPA